MQKFFVSLSIPGNMLKFLIILNIIVSLKFKKYPKSNSQVIWFHCPNLYGGATRYTTSHK